MTPHSQINGTIFLSHANEDKDLVNAVYERLDASSTFFDIRTMEAGQLTIERRRMRVRNGWQSVTDGVRADRLPPRRTASLGRTAPGGPPA